VVSSTDQDNASVASHVSGITDTLASHETGRDGSEEVSSVGGVGGGAEGQLLVDVEAADGVSGERTVGLDIEDSSSEGGRLGCQNAVGNSNLTGGNGDSSDITIVVGGGTGASVISRLD
jgi:hypothetical protein